MDVNIEKLREDLKSYFGSAMFMVSPMAMMEIAKVERAADEELIEIAEENGFNLDEY